MKRRQFIEAALLSTGTGALAQGRPTGLVGNYPNKPVRVIVSSSPGGGSDITTRLVMQKLSERWGHPIVLENVPGANGIVATNLVAKAPADGYMLLAAASSTVVAAVLGNKVPYDIRTAFVPISLFSTQPYILAVSNSVPANTLQEFLAYAKARPGQLNYASSGLGGSSHIGMEHFNLMAGLKTTHIPYKGIGPGLTDLMAGTVQLLFGSVLSVMPHVTEGRMKALAVTSAKRTPMLPSIPAIAEAVPGFELSGWYGLMGPAAMPSDVVTALNRELAQVVASSDVTEKFTKLGAETPQASPSEFRALILRELDVVATVVRETGMKIE